MKIAVIGQSVFALEVYKLLRKNGHEVVGVFTIPDQNGKEDPLAQEACKDGVAVFKFQRWCLKDEVVPEVLEQYNSVGAELNAIPYYTLSVSKEVLKAPKYQSIVFHPSLLPKHRGPSAVNWTLIQGDQKGGFTIFWPDDITEAGPILLQRECNIDPDDTVDSLYRRCMLTEGIKAMGEAVDLVAAGKAPRIQQGLDGSSYEPNIIGNPALSRSYTRCWKMGYLCMLALCLMGWFRKEVSWDLLRAQELHNLIRGCDKVPGAWTLIDGHPVKFFSSTLWEDTIPDSDEVRQIPIPEMTGGVAYVHSYGMLLTGIDGNYVNVEQLGLEDGRLIVASKFALSPGRKVTKAWN